MSASLVGSEMCIRDRPKPLRPAPTARAVARVGTGSPLASSPGPWGCPSVSYTHLTLPTICSV
eukprot:9114475-Alexandrium_andersonii.AAC.1